MPDAPTARLTVGGDTFAVGDLVETHLGAGYITAIVLNDDLPICVRLHTPKAEGSLFWFTEREVTVIREEGA